MFTLKKIFYWRYELSELVVTSPSVLPTCPDSEITTFMTQLVKNSSNLVLPLQLPTYQCKSCYVYVFELVTKPLCLCVYEKLRPWLETTWNELPINGLTQL